MKCRMRAKTDIFCYNNNQMRGQEKISFSDQELFKFITENVKAGDVVSITSLQVRLARYCQKSPEAVDLRAAERAMSQGLETRYETVELDQRIPLSGEIDLESVLARLPEDRRDAFGKMLKETFRLDEDDDGLPERRSKFTQHILKHADSLGGYRVIRKK